VVALMAEDCGHSCCLIRSNAYHVHASDPGDCDRCTSEVPPRVATLTDELAHPAHRLPPLGPGAAGHDEARPGPGVVAAGLGTP
jgi:hypothetical protein